MWQYRTFHLDPTLDVDKAIDAYAREGWQTWAAGRGAQCTINGRRVHVLSLRRWVEQGGRGLGDRRGDFGGDHPH